MNKERYQKTMAWLGIHPKLTNFFILAEKFCELFVYIVYPTFLTYLAVHNRPLFLRSALICFIPFVLVSILRKVLNAKRPYEVYGISAAMKKDKKGNSMPSRHVFSAAIISVNFFFVFPIMGVVCGILALVMAALRVVLGVHFVRDVAAGALIGIAFGLLGNLIF